MRTEDGLQSTDQINFILIELSKLSEILTKPVEQLTPLEMWSIFFKFAPDVKRRDVVNKVIAEKEELRMASALLMEISQDEHQRAKYRSRRMFETDKFHNEATIEERAMLKVARNLKSLGDPVEKIMTATGLTFAQIEKL